MSEMTFEFPIDGPIDEKQYESGGKIPPGWYLARVEQVYPDPENPAWKIEYELTAGPWSGKRLNDTLFDPRSAEDDEQRKKSTDRFMMVTGRIGAREKQSNKVNFSAAFGTPVILHLKRPQTKRCLTCDETPPKSDRRKTCERCGNKYEWVEDKEAFANVAYDGVYPLDHDKVPDEVRKELGITVPKRAVDSKPTTPAPASAVTPASTSKSNQARPAPQQHPVSANNIDDL